MILQGFSQDLSHGSPKKRRILPKYTRRDSSIVLCGLYEDCATKDLKMEKKRFSRHSNPYGGRSELKNLAVTTFVRKYDGGFFYGRGRSLFGIMRVLS